MSDFQVENPIVNSPYEEPKCHWEIRYGEQPRLVDGRREAGYWVYEAHEDQDADKLFETGTWVPLYLVNQIRQRVAEWRTAGYPGASSVTLDLLRYWHNPDRDFKLFFAQIEAAETVIFLREARGDLLQGIDVPPELEAALEDGYRGFTRYAMKMATGAGKTMVMGMLAAWSILNKAADRQNADYSDTILVVCPNVTIRQRLQELKPELGHASIYATRDLVPPALLGRLCEGKVVVTNWHKFEPRTLQEGGVSAAVIRRGKAVETTDKIHVGPRNETKRGKLIMTAESLEQHRTAGMLGEVIEEKHDRKTGELTWVRVKRLKYVETDRACALRVMKELGIKGKRNVLVFNDEAHHAYRVQQVTQAVAETAEEAEQLESEAYRATVWVDGLDRIDRYAVNKGARGLNFAVDFSATPFYLSSIGELANQPYRWIVSDFGLVDSIESGMVKVPQLALRDASGEEHANYFNLWNWIVRKKLGVGERGGAKAQPKPEAILRHAVQPISLLASEWEAEYERWEQERGDDDLQRPVFILVCKNTKLAKMIYGWLAEDECPEGIVKSKLNMLKNTDGELNTIRVDSKVVEETDTDSSKDDENRWMRFTLDTVGKREWPTDELKRPVYPPGFEELAVKLAKPLHPPGRDVRCIVSVGMLTEGWDCTTVTHIVGLRPFTTQLLCEQVAGRGLRRIDYELDEQGMFGEEVAQILGVPFEVIPFKAKTGTPRPRTKRKHVYAMPEKARYEITFPRVEGYYHVIRNRIAVDWQSVPELLVDQTVAPTEVQVKMQFPGNVGAKSFYGPGRMDQLTLDRERAKLRPQGVVFELAAGLTASLISQQAEETSTDRQLAIPPHELFRQVLAVVQRYAGSKVRIGRKNRLVDLWFAPYCNLLLETLREHIRPDTDAGEQPELPRYERQRREGSTADVEFFTSKLTSPIERSHLNLAVYDTGKWEQQAAYLIDTHDATYAFVKNDRLGFAVPYLYQGQTREYIPDFIVRLNGEAERYLIIEPKGWDPKAQHKKAAAERWCKAVNAEGSYGHWDFRMVMEMSETTAVLDEFM